LFPVCQVDIIMMQVIFHSLCLILGKNINFPGKTSMFTKFGTSLLGRCFLIVVLFVMELGAMPAGQAVALSPDATIFDPSLTGSGTQAAAGDLDTTFGTNGIVATDFNNGSDVGRSAVLQPDGKIIVGGVTYIEMGFDFVLARYMPDGSLDPSFGNNGKVVTDFTGSDNGYAVALQADGKILLAGTALYSVFELARYNTNGSLDTTFDGDGVVTTESVPGYGNITAWEQAAVVVQTDGKIVIAGSAAGSAPGSYNFVLIRYKNDGSLDTGFGVNGIVMTDFGPNSEGTALAIQPEDGKIVIAGGVGDGNNNSIALVRYNSDGSLDTTFDSDGMVTTSVGVENFAVDLALQLDGKILTAGTSKNDKGDQDFVMIRHKSDGSLDTTFGTDGIVMTDFGSVEYCLSIAVQQDGHIILAGAGNYSSTQVLARYQSNGSLDPTFGVNGKVITQPAYPLAGFDVILQPDHNIVVAGFTGEGGDFALTRYIGDATPSTPSVTTIISDSPDPSYRNGSFTVNVQVTGESTPPSGTVDVSGGGNVACTITLSNGSGSCSLSYDTAGPKVLTATYNGDDTYLPSSDTEDHTVVIPPATNGVRYVKWNAGGANNGTSWTDAYTDLQSALADASSGDQIWVAAGTYKPTTGSDRSISFNLHNNVAVYGGFAGTETLLAQRNPAANPTVLSGDLGIPNNNSDNSYHVLVGSGTNNTAILDGFTVNGGNANGSSPNDQGGGMYNYKGASTIGNVAFVSNSASFGGGMYNSGDTGAPGSGSSPVLTNVSFTNNTASEGGGMENQFYSSPTLNNVVFTSNTAVRSGGGMLNYEQSNPNLTDVTFTGNNASAGGGMSNWIGSHPTLERVTFSGNSAGNGGGMANDASSPSLHNVIFESNTATIYGGGMSNDNQSSPSLLNVTFSGNKAFNASADTYGGGMTNTQSSPTLNNVTFHGNSATHGGGLLNRDADSAPVLTNVTFSGNTAAVEGGAIADDSNMVVRNGIFWGNNGGEIFTLNLNGNPSVTYSIVQGGFTGTGNLNLNPLLGSLANNGGFTKTMAIGVTSPAVDAGDDAHCSSPDQRGVTRPQRAHCDIGAYEYEDLTPPTVLSIVRTNPSPISASTVSFTVTFSESVVNVDSGDFSLATTGVTDASIANVTGSGASYTVTVNAGSGNGTIRLDLVDDDSIKDAANLPLGGTGAGNGSFTSGETYTILWITISGNAGVPDVTLSYTDGTLKTAVADGSGNYSFLVSYNWSGTVTPSRTGYNFSPANKAYSNLISNRTGENYTASAITYLISGNAGVAGATLSYTDGSAKTATSDSNGDYSFTVSYNWSGTVTLSKTGYSFSPASKTYSNLNSNRVSQNYTATAITYTISGNAGTAGATLSYTDGLVKTATADGSGNYSFQVSYNWSGTVTPSKTGYSFSPASRTYTSLTADQTVQNYAATAITYIISGNASASGVTLSYTDGTLKTASTDGSGNYSFTVSYNWSGTVTPSRTGYTFSPSSITYSNVTSNKTAQNYVIPSPSASFDAWPMSLNTGSSTEFHIVNNLNIATCSWDYGDGSALGTACTSYHTHTYSNPGFYTVSLTVTGPGGSNSMTRTRYITVYPTLVVNKTGDGTGTVTSSPGGINCGASCSGNFTYQTTVTLTAIPAAGSTFVGWSGGGCSGTDPCTVTVSTGITVSAHFEKIVANCPSITGWKGEYWVNSTFTGSPVLCRSDASLNFDWGSGSPDPAIPADHFSAQWTRTVNLSGGTYLFHVDHDDGARLYIDDMVNPVLDKWGICCIVDTSDPITLSDGDHVIRMEYYEGTGEANARLWWEKASPDVISVTRADSDPTGSSSVHFNVTFSESVTGVDASDFSLTSSGLTGAAITGVFGSGAARTVTVSTGMGNGTLRLDVVDNDSILNGSDFPLGGEGSGNGNFAGGEFYTVRKNPTFADVPTSHPYYLDIEILYANGFTSGCGTAPLRFCPDKTMNRGEAAVFILRGNYGASFLPGSATHVLKDDWRKAPWAEPWSEAMYKKGLSAGCSTSPLKYCPWDNIPREQAVIFALRLKYGNDYKPPAATGTVFADMTNPNYFATSWTEAAYKDGLIPSCGTSGGKPKICPKALVSRGLAAYMIVRAKNLTMP
jgi:uncharacterized delta-60 repeat protein